MRRTVILIIAQVIVAAAAAANIALYKLAHLLAPAQGATDAAAFAALAVVGFATVLMVFAARGSARPPVLASLFIVTTLAGFAPQVTGSIQEQRAHARRDAENRQIEETFLRDFDRWKADVAARIAQRRPFDPDRALDLVEFVNSADLSYRSLRDHSDVAIPLLKSALEEKIVDPNARVRGRHANDEGEEPLFVYFYRDRIAVPKKYNSIRLREWDLLQLLVAHGADLNDPAARAVKEDLAKNVVRDPPDGRFLRLE